ncbi:MAG: hypothetical protein ACYTG5_22350, partial [Planctomycetota bacterium]
IHLEPHPKRQYRLTILGEELAWIQKNFAAGTLTEPIDFGDIYLQAGSRLNGRVIFENGEPIASQPFELQLDEESGVEAAPEGFEHELRRYMTTDSKGEFSGKNLSLGSWGIMMGGGLQLSSPKRINTLSVGTQDVVIIVSGDGSSGIKGIARTEDGEPFAGAYVHAYSGFNSSNARTKKDGSFQLFGKGKVGEEVTLYLSSNNDDYEPIKQNLRSEWGEQDLKVFFRKVVSTGLDLTVVDAVSGEPIEEYGVRCFPTPFLNNRQGNKAVRLNGPHDAGRVRVDELREGSNILIVLPEDPAYAPGKIVYFDVDQASTAPIRVAIEKNKQLLVRVQDAAGNPLEGARVELLRAQADNPITQQNDNYVRPMRAVGEAAGSMSYEKMFTNYYGIDMAWRMAEARTDEAGMATVRSTVPSVAHALRASMPDRPSSQLNEVSFAESAGVHVITMFEGAGLELTFRPAELLDKFTERGHELGVRLLALTGEGDEEPPAQPSNWETWELPRTGELSKMGLLPGEWRVMLQGLHQIDVGTYQTMETELAKIDLDEGKILELNIDPSAFIPSRIRGHLLVTGKAVQNPRLTVRRGPDPGAESERLYYPNQVTVNPTGEFETPPLSPGPYQFQLSLGAGGRTTSFPWTEAIQLGPAQSIVHNLDLAAAALDLRVRDASGQSLPAGCRVTLIEESKNGARITGSLDEQSRLELELVPVGSYRCKVAVEGESKTTARVQIAAGSANVIERQIVER